jgi:hypothetical protein
MCKLIGSGSSGRGASTPLIVEFHISGSLRCIKWKEMLRYNRKTVELKHVVAGLHPQSPHYLSRQP